VLGDAGAKPRFDLNMSQARSVEGTWTSADGARVLPVRLRRVPRPPCFEVGVVESVRGPAVKLPSMGGNLPLANIERSLGTRTIIVPIANHDNNQHSFDENLRIQNLWDGIELIAALLTM
jgi:hypothetical protein